ncbi:phosphatidylserine decarboxylase [Polyrhizophydium stewartii]|uniref:phosphatidylserine decarboxylase n=1 Tax=Polyrhizophydium stewartii TaxID=2732419 RepID=A0ABR4NAU1_9FUNG
MISAFVAFHNIDLDEILEPMESFKTFNQFFCRKLKPSARIADSADPLVALSPADARTTVFKTVQAATQLWIKGSSFTIASLLGSDEEARLHLLSNFSLSRADFGPQNQAKRFEHGSLAIFRLAPQDYHRFHFPVDGVVRETRSIDGTLFAVNPIAVRSVIDVYTENLRTVTTMDSTHFGRVAIVAIGAMLTGSIVLSTKPGTMVRRMDEHGFFKFGGSTIVVLFEAGVIDFSSDLLENSSQALETLVRVGSAIGGRRQV